MKGLRGDPKISKRICRNNDDDEMCFITVFVKYLKSKYNIDIKVFKKKKMCEMLKRAFTGDRS